MVFSTTRSQSNNELPQHIFAVLSIIALYALNHVLSQFLNATRLCVSHFCILLVWHFQSISHHIFISKSVLTNYSLLLIYCSQWLHHTLSSTTPWTLLHLELYYTLSSTTHWEQSNNTYSGRTLGADSMTIFSTNETVDMTKASVSRQ